MTMNVTRRTMLRGMGAALALPWLESLRTGRTRGREVGHAAGPDVLLVRPQRRASARPGSRSKRDTLVDLPETLQPLSFAREYLNCFHGLTHNTALTNGDSEGCGHGQGSASFLTGAQAFKTQDAVRVGHLRRPALCAPRRQRDPLSQPRARLRVGPIGQRVRLQRDLQDAHLLAHADLARPLRDESQAGL